MITFKRIRGKFIVTVNGQESVFSLLWDATEFIYATYVRRIKNTL